MYIYLFALPVETHPCIINIIVELIFGLLHNISAPLVQVCNIESKKVSKLQYACILYSIFIDEERYVIDDIHVFNIDFWFSLTYLIYMITHFP